MHLHYVSDLKAEKDQIKMLGGNEDKIPFFLKIFVQMYVCVELEHKAIKDFLYKVAKEIH